jgi:hypothetical protein
MLRPSRQVLYALVAVFLVLALLKFLVAGFAINLLLVILLIGLFAYFVAVAVFDVMRARR